MIDIVIAFDDKWLVRDVPSLVKYFTKKLV